MNYVIILNWRNIEDTVHCVNSLLQVNTSNLSIIVCDNDSGDSSLDKLNESILQFENTSLVRRNIIKLSENDISEFGPLSEKPTIYLMQNNENYGYAGGNNRGITLALKDRNCEYVWLLNNDTEVTENSFSGLYNKMQQDLTIGICGSVLLLEDDRERLQGVGGGYNPKLCTTWHVLGNTPYSELKEYNCDNVKIDYVIGASMLIRASALRELGMLSEDYFLYYEEIDFCLKIQKRYRISYAEESIVYHKLGSTIKKSKSVLADYLSVKNRLVVTRKFYPKYYAIVWASLIIVLFNRLKRSEFLKAKNVFKAMTIDAINVLIKFKSV